MKKTRSSQAVIPCTKLSKTWVFPVSIVKTNNIIVNPDKFQSMSISSKKDLGKFVLNINDIKLTMEFSVKFLGIEIDSKLNFEKHISNTCKKVSNQLNATCRLQRHLCAIKKKKQ